MIREVVIEIPKDSIYKYEIKNNILYLDRQLSDHCPQNYGFIPNTLAPDNDPVDVFVISWAPIVPGAHVNVKLEKVLICEDNGVRDDKLVGVMLGENLSVDSYFNNIHIYLNKYKPGFKVLEVQDINLYEQSLISQTLP